MFKPWWSLGQSLISLSFLPHWLRMASYFSLACGLMGYIALWSVIGLHAQAALNNPPARQADAALILGSRAYLNGAPNPCLVGRVEAGVSLTTLGMTSTLVMSGGRDKEDGRIEAQTMQKIALGRGFQGNILLESQSRSTKENFTLSRPLLQSAGIKSIIVVTEPYHLWRAQKLTQAGYLGHDFDIQFKAAPSQCWQTWGMFYKGALREPLAIANNFVKGYFKTTN